MSAKDELAALVHELDDDTAAEVLAFARGLEEGTERAEALVLAALVALAIFSSGAVGSLVWRHWIRRLF